MTDKHPYPSMRYLKCVAPCEKCGELIELCEKYQGRALTACHAPGDCPVKKEPEPPKETINLVPLLFSIFFVFVLPMGLLYAYGPSAQERILIPEYERPVN